VLVVRQQHRLRLIAALCSVRALDRAPALSLAAETAARY
jgi:hypothetical protein